MTARAASIETYHDTGFMAIAGLQRQRIADLLRERGPMTRREIAAELHMETSSVSGRVRELLDAKTLTELPGQRPCPITKRNVSWVCHTNNYCQQRGLPL